MKEKRNVHAHVTEYWQLTHNQTRAHGIPFHCSVHFVSFWGLGKVKASNAELFGIENLCIVQHYDLQILVPNSVSYIEFSLVLINSILYG